MRLPFDDTRRRRIYLMRHGDVAYFDTEGRRVPDSRTVSLTLQGRAEATAMRDLLSTVPFDYAICSGLKRTVETAGIVLGGRSLNLESIPELEEIRGGDPIARAKLSPPDYAYAMFQAGISGACYAQGEAFKPFYERVNAALDGIIARQDWRCLLLVAHGGVNRAVLCRMTHAGLAGFGAFEQDTACVNVIDVDTCLDTGAARRYILRAVNLTADDTAKAQSPLITMERLALKAFPQGRHRG